MTPGDYVLENLTVLCNDYLEPIRKALGGVSIYISSGFRPLALNTAIGGSLTSAHMVGRAGDLIVAGMKPLQVARVIRDLDLDYDQIIHEFGDWVHFGYSDVSTSRRQDLTAYRKGGKVCYFLGLCPIKDLV